MVGQLGDIANAVGAVQGGSTGGKANVTGDDFASFLSDAATGAVDAMKQGEQMSMKGIAGEADLNEVVQAVGNAEMTLQLVTAIRDKMISAYQEVLRMPI